LGSDEVPLLNSTAIRHSDSPKGQPVLEFELGEGGVDGTTTTDDFRGPPSATLQEGPPLVFAAAPHRVSLLDSVASSHSWLSGGQHVSYEYVGSTAASSKLDKSTVTASELDDSTVLACKLNESGASAAIYKLDKSGGTVVSNLNESGGAAEYKLSESGGDAAAYKRGATVYKLNEIGIDSGAAAYKSNKRISDTAAAAARRREIQ